MSHIDAYKCSFTTYLERIADTLKLVSYFKVFVLLLGRRSYVVYKALSTSTEVSKNEDFI